MVQHKFAALCRGLELSAGRGSDIDNDILRAFTEISRFSENSVLI